MANILRFYLFKVPTIGNFTETEVEERSLGAVVKRHRASCLMSMALLSGNDEKALEINSGDF